MSTDDDDAGAHVNEAVDNDAAGAHANEAVDDDNADRQTSETVDAGTEENDQKSTWRDASGREGGADGYVPFDFTRSAVRRLSGMASNYFGGAAANDMNDAKAGGSEKDTAQTAALVVADDITAPIPEITIRAYDCCGSTGTMRPHAWLITHPLIAADFVGLAAQYLATSSLWEALAYPDAPKTLEELKSGKSKWNGQTPMPGILSTSNWVLFDNGGNVLFDKSDVNYTASRSSTLKAARKIAKPFFEMMLASHDEHPIPHSLERQLCIKGEFAIGATVLALRPSLNKHDVAHAREKGRFGVCYIKRFRVKDLMYEVELPWLGLGARAFLRPNQLKKTSKKPPAASVSSSTSATTMGTGMGISSILEVLTQQKRIFRDAAKAGGLEKLKRLHAEHSDIESTSNYGMTALHSAAKHGRFDAVQWLIEHGANPSIKHNGGKTPLDETRDNVSNAPDVELEQYNKVIRLLSAPAIESAQRVAQYLNGEKLDPYLEQEETKSQAVNRFTGYGLTAGKHVVSLFGAKFRLGFEVTNLAYKHGKYGLFFAFFKGDIEEIMTTVLGIWKNATRTNNVTADDIIRGVPYKLAHSEAATQLTRQNWHGSGRVDPKASMLSAKRPPIADSIWSEIGHFAILACEYAYMTPPEAQRKIEQYRGIGKELLMEPYTLVLAKTAASVDRPAFHLVAHKATKRLVLVIRGSANPLDWVANFRFKSETLFVPRVQVDGRQMHGGLRCLGRVHYVSAVCKYW
jgi:hypothetical protein